MPNRAETSSSSGKNGGLQVPTQRWSNTVCPIVSLWFEQTVVVLVWPVKVQPGFLETVGKFLESSLKQPLLPCLSADAKKRSLPVVDGTFCPGTSFASFSFAMRCFLIPTYSLCGRKNKQKSLRTLSKWTGVEQPSLLPFKETSCSAWVRSV